jgi:hypothetical protein
MASAKRALTLLESDAQEDREHWAKGAMRRNLRNLITQVAMPEAEVERYERQWLTEAEAHGAAADRHRTPRAGWT